MHAEAFFLVQYCKASQWQMKHVWICAMITMGAVGGDVEKWGKIDCCPLNLHNTERILRRHRVCNQIWDGGWMDEFVPLCPISFHLGHGHSIRFVYSMGLRWEGCVHCRRARRIVWQPLGHHFWSLQFPCTYTIHLLIDPCI